MKKTWITGALALLTTTGLPGRTEASQAGSDGDEAIAAVVRGNEQFALKLYGGLREREGNLFLSPYSLRSALAMTFAGARGETARQMKETLCLQAEGSLLHDSLNALQRGLEQRNAGSGCELRLASALWGQAGASFVSAFLEQLEQSYGAGLRRADFARATEVARREINAWVATETKGEIEELLAPADLTPDTTLVLTNAIQLEAAWPVRFDSERTRSRSFFVIEGRGDERREREITVPTMEQTVRCGYRRTEGLKVLELPYRGGELALTILLPEARDGLEELELRLGDELLKRLLTELPEMEVGVLLPKFEARTRLQLKETLAALGMPDAFDGERADFSGMCTEERLRIDAVVHEAAVQVDEEGTRAAGATAVVMKKGGPIFHADRPFLFLIRDLRTGATLFLGRVVDPTQG